MNKNSIRGRFSPSTIALQAFVALIALTMASVASAVPSSAKAKKKDPSTTAAPAPPAASPITLTGETAEFYFNLPATSAQKPPYEVIATLTLEEEFDSANNRYNVRFTLDPNEDNDGFTHTTPTIDPNGDSRVERLDIAFIMSAAPTPFSWSNVSGAMVETIELETNQNNFDSGYKAADQHLIINFFNPNGNGPKTDFSPRFNVGETSTWRIEGAAITQFTTTQATTTSNKPRPIFGVISVSPFAHPDQTPNPSNWVAGTGGPITVPEPTNLALLGIGLIGFVVARRHAKN